MQIPIKLPKTSNTDLKQLVSKTISVSRNATPEQIALAQRVDKDELSVIFEDFIVPRRLKRFWRLPEKHYDRFIEFIVKDAKLQYPIPRPQALAKKFGIPFTPPFKAKYASGTSYPSAHAASIWFVVYYLLPKLSYENQKALLSFARQLTITRLVAGVHTLQDIGEGRRLAKEYVATYL